MWAYVKDGTIKQTNTNQTKLEINPGSYFPVKYANEWTIEQKNAYGVYEVEVSRTNFKNPAYYVNSVETFAYDSDKDKVTQSWGSATGKSLTDVNYTQADEDAGLGTKDELNYRGLTYLHKEVISRQAHTILNPTDWYASRKAETSTAIPTAVANYRAAVRTKAADMHTKIGNADTVAKLEALYVYTDGSRPLGEWPDSVS